MAAVSGSYFESVLLEYCFPPTPTPRKPSIRTELKPVPPADKPLSLLGAGCRGILTAVPTFSKSKIGDFVLRGYREYIFPRDDGSGYLSDSYAELQGYRFRPLTEDDDVCIDGDSVEVDAAELPPADKPLTAMPHCSWGILTGQRAGDPVYRGHDGRFHYPKHGGYDLPEGNPYRRFRPLQPGEKIIVE